MERQYTQIDQVRALIDTIIKAIEDEETKRCAYVHLYGVGLMAAMIALKRGHSRRTAELAEIAGMLHDLLKYHDPTIADHAHEGAEFARRQVLDKLDCLTEEEKQLVYDGIYNHSDKHIKSTPFDEIIKDADVLQHSLRNPCEDYYYFDSRMQQLLDEIID
ncbi:HD domain-containing protein [Ruminococcus albus]|uniref:Metal-dependent phosphohydrolase HD sub domain n=1 Tax=Ruminococcus albus (strain ATCC 27210 / DSM 20455 / JCM 14654 / NCDO 2250 / 7) TaxID=697329 RepID=E6UI12_RUMA7|nr:HD domain-containing protein [Ruminococcus albus]ADU21265.1 metal-dependent phosphohydrolase HD sub domain [Ruminococcus albus 7 = DSM 20455]